MTKKAKSIPDEKPMDSIGMVIAKKKAKATKSQKDWLNCAKCNKAYRSTENLAKHEATCTGKHPGGMPAGHMSPEKLQIKEQKKLMQERIASNVDKLLNAQMNLALGQTMLYVKITERDSKGKVLRTYHERVENPETIKQFLDDPNELDDDEHYHYITTRPANNQALTNLLDRAFGKPKENIEVGEDPDAPIGVAGTGTTSAVRQMVLDTIRQQLKKPKGGK